MNRQDKNSSQSFKSVLHVIQTFLVLTTLFLTLPGQTADPKLPSSQGLRLGWEVELLPDKLANLTPLFDFGKLQAQAPGMLEMANAQYFDLHEGDITDSYLTNNPRALDSLPADVRAQLTEGLELKATVIKEEQELLGADGKPVTAQKPGSVLLPDTAQAPKPAGSLILPGAATQAPQSRGGLITSTDAPAAKTAPVAGADSELFHSKGSLQLPNRVDWQKLNERWRAMNPDDRHVLVKWELLGPKEKALIAREGGSFLKLKKNIPKEDRELFSKLEWNPDQDAVEFVYREDHIVKDPEEFLRDLRQLARRAGVEREIFDPEAAASSRITRNAAGQAAMRPSQWGSLHYHVSKKGADLDPVAERLNRLIFLKRLNLGILSDLTGGEYVFSPDLRAKGVMRQVNRERIEIRAHHEPLEQELNQYLRAIAAKPEDAVQMLDSEIERRLSPDILKKIEALKPDYLADLAPHLKAEHLRHLKPETASHLEFVRGIASDEPWPQTTWEGVRKYFGSTNGVRRTNAQDARVMGGVAKQENWPASFWEDYVNLIHRNDAAVMSLLEQREHLPSIPPKQLDEMGKMLSEGNSSAVHKVVKTFVAQNPLPEAAWDGIIQGLMTESADRNVRIRQLRGILDLSIEWPEKLWAKLPQLLENPSSRDIVLDMLSSRQRWEAPRLTNAMRNASPEVRRIVSQRFPFILNSGIPGCAPTEIKRVLRNI